MLTLQTSLRSLLKKLRYWFLKLVLIFVSLSIGWVLIYKFVPVPYTPLMAIQYFKNTHIEHTWQPVSKISKHLQLAVISAEDQHFFEHSGFDYAAIKFAFINNLKGKRLRGGSTISQQCAKNVFLWPQRSWVRKGLETWFTLLIELLWSKERILEVYLNSIEMGKGTFGASAAAKHWFKIPASQLNRQQSAAIAAILPNPNKYSAQPATYYIRSRKAWIIKQMKNHQSDYFK